MVALARWPDQLCFARRYRRAWIETDSKLTRSAPTRVSPAGIGGRGLKPTGRAVHAFAQRFARRYRRAWIETGQPRTHPNRQQVSPAGIGGRGLKLVRVRVSAPVAGVSPAGIGGRGLKHSNAASAAGYRLVSPAGIGGRGLKLDDHSMPSRRFWFRPPVSAGVD